MSATLEPTVLVKSKSNSDNLASNVIRALRATGYPEIYKLDVSVHEREVRLRGRVSSYYFRQRAEYAAAEIPGVRKVNSDIEIRK